MIATVVFNGLTCTYLRKNSQMLFFKYLRFRILHNLNFTYREHERRKEIFKEKEAFVFIILNTKRTKKKLLHL